MSYDKVVFHFCSLLHTFYIIDLQASIIIKEINVYPDIDTTITKLMYTLTAVSGADSYQWFDCGTNLPISGATTANYTATQNGIYKVLITKNNCTKYSSCQYVGGIGMEEIRLSNILKYFPNPVTENLTIDLGYTNSKTLIQVFSIDGKCILNEVVRNIQKYELDVRKLSAGMYIVKILTDTDNTNFRIEKF